MGNTAMTPVVYYYAIYDMINNFVSFKLPSRYGGDVVRGMVTNVFRDVIHHIIEITIKNNNNKYVFPEPDSIICNGNFIVFVYGSVIEASDDQFFEECKRMSCSGSIDDVFKSFDCEHYAIPFELVDSNIININRSKRQKKMKKHGR